MAETTVKKVKIEIDGKEALVDINAIKKALKETSDEGKKVEKTNFGNANKQIRNLTDSFKAGEIGLKGFVKGILSVGKALTMTFITNPILLAITAIVGAIAGLVAIFKTFTPIVEKVQQIWAGLTAGFNTFKVSVTNWISGNKKFKDSFNDLGKSMKDAAQGARELKKAEQDLEDQQILLELSNADLENQINRLLLQSRDRTKSEKERIKAIDDAMALEEEKFKQTKEVNEDEIRIAKGYLAKKLKISDEQLEKIGINGANELNGKQINADKEIEIYKNALLKGKALEGQKIQLEEKTQNRRNQILETQETNRQKVHDDELKRIETQETNRQKAHDNELKRIEKEKEAREKIEKERLDALADLVDSTNEFNSIMDNFFNEMVDADNEVADERIESEKRVTEAKQGLANEEAKTNFENIQQKIEDEKTLNDAKFELALNSLEAISTLDEAFTARSLSREKDLLSKKLISQGEYDKRVAEIEKKAAQREKAYAVMSTSINTAASIMNMLTVKPAEAGVILSIAAGILGAAQIAAILATPIDGSMPSTNTSSTSNLQQSAGTSPNTSFSFSQSPTTPEIQPVKTYVISKDVQTQQQLDRQVISNGTI